MISFLYFVWQITNIRQDFPKISSTIKDLLVKPPSFAITLRGPAIWSSLLNQQEKSIPHLLSVLKQIKFKLLNSNKETENSTSRLWLMAMSDVTLYFICLSVCLSSMLNIASSDSLVDKLTSISDLNELLVLDDKICEPSRSSYHINSSNSLNNDYCNYYIVFLWYGEINKWKWNEKVAVSQADII